ncbi:MAG: TonB-dependent siderophore receptor [Comamonas sp.]
MSTLKNTPTDINALHCELTQIVVAAGLCLMGGSALAQQEVTLPSVQVNATSDAAFNPQTSPQGKFTAPLVDTPKTVQVIGEEILKQTGATSLQEALKSTPGITFGNGEGGNPTGDQPFIRGMDSQASTFVDGMRDIAVGTREVFNLESVEVIKGADSAYAGRGGAGGSINLTTKKAKNEDFISGDVGLGTDNYKRATLDLNRKLGETTGFRLNAMAHDADIPGRDGPTNQRWGIAPTVTFGMGTPTEVSLSWQHVQTDNIPDSGMPYNIPKTALNKLPGGTVIKPTYGNSRDNWYGLTDRDYEKEKTDLFTASVEHKFTDTNKFRNTFRYSKSDLEYIWTQPDDSKGNIPSGYVYRRGNSRLAEVTTVQNVSEFLGKALTGSIEHSFAVGMELSKEKSDVRTASGLTLSNASCSTASQWCASLNNPNSSVPWTVSTPWGTTSTQNKIDTVGLYGFDTIKLNEQWQINAGVRADHYKVQYTTSTTDIDSTDTLFNYQMGVVYKPAPNGSIYASIGTSSKPGGGTLGNGNEDQTITDATLADLAAEKTRSYEIGTKWELLDKKLGVTAAVFRNEVTNLRINDASGVAVMSGGKVVNGIELGFNGRINAAWSVFGGYTFMDSELKDGGYSCRSGVCTAPIDGVDFPNTPKHSFSLWTSYKPTNKLTLGLGVYAQSSVNQGYTRATDGGIITRAVNGYARYDAMLGYQINRNLAFQLNLYNLGDKVYYSGVRSPHYANIAAGRSAVASLKFTY